ncbi:Aste57867_18049 [Aphanomyces stellatus]|uniref:Aste57867_18049 protein n=1 Tax=Aphanomyces stellatus TaxID=120398 RepID=A0A485L909_9STRA|nr:hypothetical protein As57867_017987 [Aphanomyces stellatus]VFT94788.1 Aste57867_18049 [Aphanomyces stellatus]
MDFLPVEDKVRLLSSSRSLSREALATDLKTFCGKCGNCTSCMEHLCEHSRERKWTSAIWFNIFKRFGHSVTSLSLVGCNDITIDAFESAEARSMLKELKVLRVEKCNQLGEENLKHLLAECESLREVHVRDMSLNDDGLSALLNKNRSTIRTLDLTGCHKLVGDSLRLLNDTNLEHLCLEGCHRIKLTEIQVMSTVCESLKSLNLRYCHNVNDSVVKFIAFHLPYLETLNLRYCYKLTDDGVRSICTSLFRLKALDLSQCPRISDSAVWAIAESLFYLKELRLWGCRQLTPSSIVASFALPSLTLVDIRNEEWILHGSLTVAKETYRNILQEWEQSEAGVFKRPSLIHRSVRQPMIRQHC